MDLPQPPGYCPDHGYGRIPGRLFVRRLQSAEKRTLYVFHILLTFALTFFHRPAFRSGLSFAAHKRKSGRETVQGTSPENHAIPDPGAHTDRGRRLRGPGIPGPEGVGRD